MTKEVENKIIKAANYIINNKATISECANYLEMSVSSVKKYINDSDKLQTINKELYDKVKEVQNEIEHQGQIKGAKTGDKISYDTYTDFEITEIIDEMLKKSLTLKEASAMFSIPKSSLYERIINYPDKEKLKEVKKLFGYNKSRAFDNVNKLDK